MGDVREIVHIGHPVLRKKALPVESVESPEIQRLIEDLNATLAEAEGVGIAAPQTGVSLRLFIITSRPDPEGPDMPEMESTAIINPRIITHSSVIVKDWEGCLSVPGIRGLVPRFESITVEYQLRDGRTEEREFTGFVARVFQHEYDHLEGLVYLDRLESVKDIISEIYCGE